jgi:hypothetical protein
MSSSSSAWRSAPPIPKAIWKLPSSTSSSTFYSSSARASSSKPARSALPLATSTTSWTSSSITGSCALTFSLTSRASEYRLYLPSKEDLRRRLLEWSQTDDAARRRQ